MVQIKERLLADIKIKYDSLKTDLTKMEYLESVLKISEVGLDVKSFAFSQLSVMYDRRLMFDKAAKAMASKAGYDTTYREKIDSYLKAAEYFAKAGNILSADDMFLRAAREGNSEQKERVILARKNVYLAIANDLEKKSRMSNAVKFYEHLLSLKLEDLEKSLIKKKLIEYYKKVGRFNDAKLVESR